MITSDDIRKVIELYKSAHPEHSPLCEGCIVSALNYRNNRTLEDRAYEIVSNGDYHERIRNVRDLRMAVPGTGLKEAVETVDRATVRVLKLRRSELDIEIGSYEKTYLGKTDAVGFPLAPPGMGFPLEVQVEIPFTRETFDAIVEPTE